MRKNIKCLIIILMSILLFFISINTKTKVIDNIIRQAYFGALEHNQNIVEIKFEDDELYNAIKSQINRYINSSDDANKKIYISNSNLANVKELQLKDKGITKTAGLEKFTSLETLNISNNMIDGLTNISKITSLKNLKIENSELKNIKELNSLTNLETLDLSINNLYDDPAKPAKEDSILYQIKDLKKLKSLTMTANYIKYVEVLEAFTELTYLNLYDNNVSNLKGLENLKKLKTLNLGQNYEFVGGKITNLNVLSNLINLEELDFSQNYNPDIISAISGLTKLKYLQIEKNDIKTLTGIENLTNVIDLNLYNNQITDISKLANLNKLEILRLGSNKFSDISPLYNGVTKTAVHTNLRKLDIAYNQIEKNEALQYFCKQSRNKQIELDYEYITDTTNLPHIDTDGTKYVSYADFGARCNGEYDDYIAMRNAHLFANSVDCEIRIKDTKTYHIYHYYGLETEVRTSIDWGNAKIVIHDELIDTVSGRFVNLFNISNEKDTVTLNNPTWKINRKTKKIPELVETLSKLKGYDQFMCTAEDTNKRMYRRSGLASSGGSPQKDIFRVDASGNLLDDIQWDFDQITSITIVPISKKGLTIKNATFLHKSLISGNEARFTRYGVRTAKRIYFNRLIRVYRTSNLNISNINHELEKRYALSGSYQSFISVEQCVNVNLKDIKISSRRQVVPGRSTYELYLNRLLNYTLENVVDDDIFNPEIWGSTGSNVLKEGTYKKCKFTHIDAHEGGYNLTIQDCEFGGMGFVGQGYLKIENTHVKSKEFLILRSDYGSTWDGNVYINNCRFTYVGRDTHIENPQLIRHTFRWDKQQDGTKKIHDYGYDLKFPNLYVNGMTVDLRNTKKYNFIPVIFNIYNGTYNYEEKYKDVYDYWAENIHINDVKFINNNTGLGDAYVKMSIQPITRTTGKNYNYTLTNYSITENNKPLKITPNNDKDIYNTNQSVKFNAKYIKGSKNNVTIYKDGAEYLKSEVTENKPVDKTLTESGLYKIVINSEIRDQNSGQYDGELVYQIKINKESPTLEINYSETNPTNQNVTVTINSNKELKEIPNWQLSENKKTLTKEYTENVEELVNVQDKDGNTIATQIRISNIDKTAPTTQVTYSITELTNNPVKVTITSNEPIKPVTGWTLDNTQKILTKTFNTNAEEQVKIIDIAGNETTVNIKVANIDTTEIQAEVNYSETNPTNQNVTVTINSNKELKEVPGWQLSTNKKTLTKTFSANSEEEVNLEDLSGKTKKINISISNIDKTAPTIEVSYNITTPTNKEVIATIKSNEELQPLEGWELSADKRSLTKRYTENKTETITIKDKAGNTATAQIQISNIDKTAPTTQVTYSTTEKTNDTVKVTIISNKAIKPIEGWTLDTQQKTLTKTYTTNIDEEFEVEDLTGNKTIAKIKIENIDKTSPSIEVSYNIVTPTNQEVIVAIQSNEELQPLEGWELSADKRSLSKKYAKNKTETITIKDLAGNTATAQVNIENIDKIVPTAEVSYNITTPTNQEVIATIKSNESIKPVEEWILDNSQTTLTKTFNKNAEEQVKITDLAGNETIVNIKVANIDTTEIQAEVEYSTTILTNKDITVTINSNKELKEVSSWRLSANKKTLTKTFNANAEEEVELQDTKGRTKKVKVKISNIDKIAPTTEVSYNITANKDVIATIKSNKELQPLEGWKLSADKRSLSKKYTENKTETITIKDAAGNTKQVDVKIENINKEEPKVEVTYSTTENTTDNVIVTVKSDKEMEELEGWTLSNDKKTMTKTYNKNATETITIKYVDGSSTKTKIKVANINKENQEEKKDNEAKKPEDSKEQKENKDKGKDPKTAKGQLPKTGENKLPIIVGIAFIAIFSFVFIKLKNKR